MARLWHDKKIEKHQKLRQVVEDNRSVFAENTEEIWRSF